MSSNQFQFTLWDVGHGLAVWIKTPSGHNHWIDTGREGDFSPGKHVAKAYKETSLDYLIISHPDTDHINDLADVVTSLGKPRVFLRNKTLPDVEKFESCTLDFQKTLKHLDTTYTQNIPWEESPRNPSFNGGVKIKYGMLTWEQAGKSANNSSIVVFYQYAGWLFVLPGDIEEKGWCDLWDKNEKTFEEIIDSSVHRILVAPHHGRENGFSGTMFEDVDPHLVLISDKRAKEFTSSKFYTRPLGIEYNGETKKFFSTKSGGRMQFRIASNGQCNFHMVEK